MAIRRVMHTAVSTRDMDSSIAFWAELGFVECQRWDWPEGTDAVNELLDLPQSAARAALLEGHGTGIELFEFSCPDPGGVPEPVHRIGYTHMAFASDDLDSDMARLRDAGMSFWSEPVDDPSGRRMIYGRTPEGLFVELVQPAS
ncbi:MAG: VOC family protein [Microthrixaceae bacterium]